MLTLILGFGNPVSRVVTLILGLENYFTLILGFENYFTLRLGLNLLFRGL